MTLKRVQDQYICTVKHLPPSNTKTTAARQMQIHNSNNMIVTNLTETE